MVFFCGRKNPILVIGIFLNGIVGSRVGYIGGNHDPIFSRKFMDCRTWRSQIKQKKNLYKFFNSVIFDHQPPPKKKKKSLETDLLYTLDSCQMAESFIIDPQKAVTRVVTNRLAWLITLNWNGFHLRDCFVTKNGPHNFGRPRGFPHLKIDVS